MSKIAPQYDLTKITDPQSFMRFCAIVVGQVITGINGGLDFTNLITQTVTVQFTAANKDFKVTHALDKTGVNYIPVNCSAGCSIYNGAGSATASYFYLRSTAAATVTLLLF